MSRKKQLEELRKRIEALRGKPVEVDMGEFIQAVTEQFAYEAEAIDDLYTQVRQLEARMDVADRASAATNKKTLGLLDTIVSTIKTIVKG